MRNEGVLTRNRPASTAGQRGGHDSGVASIRTRQRKDGSVYYAVLFRAGSRQSSVSVNDRRDADYIKAHLELTGELPRAVARPEVAMTVADLVGTHIDGLSGVQAFTVSKYRGLAAMHINPVLGPMPAAGVTREIVARWVARIDRAPKTLKNIHALLSASFATGVRLGVVASNPAEGVRLPAIQRETVYLLERETFAAILAEVAPKWRILFLLLAQTGMRWGEAAALLASDVDVKRGTISITKAVKRVDGGRNMVGPTKTARSRRTISVPPSLLAELAPRLRRKGALFADLVGPALRSDSSREAWERGVRRAGVARVLMRDLRHAHASWLLEAGVPPKVVQERLGHEKIATTMEIYARVSRDADTAAAALLDDLGG
jgi:integrase